MKKEEAAAKKLIDDEELARINQLNNEEMPEYVDPLNGLVEEE